jgi:hypothetical protein
MMRRQRSKTGRFDHRNMGGPEGKRCHEMEVLGKKEHPPTEIPAPPSITRPASGKVAPALDSGT